MYGDVGFSGDDRWWTSLKVSEKERIASKIADAEVRYPATTDVWNGLDDDLKSWVREHCERRHGVVVPMWNEGDPFTD